ncbi:MAG: LysR family transcriptional regulator [Candidatus Bathyarchaeota archaeon]|nr:LysR family transcriptional regulator [Candidatus Bathyarchaeota archaeon]
MSDPSKPKPMFKMWLETDEGYVFGPGVYSLLKKVRETGTLKEAAEGLGMSYRFAWGLVKRAENKIGQPLLHAHKGGRAGGGGAEITEVGEEFIKEFSKIELMLAELSKDPVFPENLGYRNQIEAEISEIKITEDGAEVTLGVAEPAVLKVRVSDELLRRMDLAVGDKITVELATITGRIEKA